MLTYHPASSFRRYLHNEMKDKRQEQANEYWTRAYEEKQAGRYEQARKLYFKSIELLDRKSLTLCWYMIAFCDHELKNLKEAMQSLRRAERYSPNSWRIQRYIGRVQDDLHRPKLAERAFRKSLGIKPTAGTYVYLGSLLGNNGRHSEAKNCFRAAIRHRPDNEEAHYNLGLCYSYEGQYARAEKQFRRAIDIDQKYAEAHGELGWVLNHRKQYREARRALKHSVRLAPDMFWPRMYLAVTNWALRRLKEAEIQYREAIRIFPTNSLANTQLGNFLVAESRGDGEKYYRKAVAENMNNGEAHYCFGKYLYNQYREAEAVSHLRRAARRGHIESEKLLKRIEMI